MPFIYDGEVTDSLLITVLAATVVAVGSRVVTLYYHKWYRIILYYMSFLCDNQSAMTYDVPFRVMMIIKPI